MPVIRAAVHSGVRLSEVPVVCDRRAAEGRAHGQLRGLGTEEEKRCEMGRDVKELMEGGPMGGRGGMCSERLATEEEKRCVGSRLETTRAGEDLPTVVKTNLPVPWAVENGL